MNSIYWPQAIPVLIGLLVFVFLIRLVFRAVFKKKG